MSKKINRIILGGVTAVALSWVAYYLRPRQALAQPPAANSTLHVIEAKRGTISETIAASGNICSNGDVVINCQACGEVIRLPFSLGDAVKKGEVVCQLDPDIEQNEVDQAEKALAQAVRKLKETHNAEKQDQADLEISIQQAEETISSLRVKATSAKNKAERQKQLLSQSLASQEEYETADANAVTAETDFQNALLEKQELKNREQSLQTQQGTDIGVAEDAVNSATTNLNNARIRLASTTIISPMDGVISQQKTAVNSWVAPNGDFGRQELMTISDLSRIFANVSVEERQIGAVQAGQKVEITADAYPGRTFSGVVTRVALAGVSSGATVSFGTKIEVTSPDKALLKLPMSVHVRIVKQTKQEALLVPMQAVEQKESNAYVAVVNGHGGQQAREVSLGISDGANDEILRGLSAGERVLVRSGTPNWQ